MSYPIEYECDDGRKSWTHVRETAASRHHASSTDLCSETSWYCEAHDYPSLLLFSRQSAAAAPPALLSILNKSTIKDMQRVTQG